ncbi:MAG: hypothetical protein RIC30_01515 [Marinoscillum sp.]
MRNDKGNGRNQATLKIKEIADDLFIAAKTEHEDQIGCNGG